MTAGTVEAECLALHLRTLGSEDCRAEYIALEAAARGRRRDFIAATLFVHKAALPARRAKELGFIGHMRFRIDGIDSLGQLRTYEYCETRRSATKLLNQLRTEAGYGRLGGKSGGPAGGGTPEHGGGPTIGRSIGDGNGCACRRSGARV